jgi:DNA-directed RNA polymerase subunit H (RpoH/RPB5)
LELKNFLLKFFNLVIHQEVPKLKLFSQQELRNLVDKTAQQLEVQQFEAIGFQDPQAAAETSSN